MIACYDFLRNPPTYDVVAFLANVDLERARRGEDHIDLHLLPGPAGGFRRDNLWPRSPEERVELVREVVIPICRMLPAIGSGPVRLTAHTARPKFLAGECGFDARSVGLPDILRALREGSRPLRSPEPVIKFERPTITMTLREAAHHPKRNSRVSEWIAAAAALVERGYRVTIIRDTLKAGVDIDGVVTSHESSTSLLRRAAVYAGASLNMGVSNGPMWLAVFMDAPVAMLRPTTNAAGGCYDDAFYKKCGLAPGEQLPTSPTHQRLVWEDDTMENIVAAADAHFRRVGF